MFMFGIILKNADDLPVVPVSLDLILADGVYQPAISLGSVLQ